MEWERHVGRRGMLTGNAKGIEEFEGTEIDDGSTLKWM